MALSSRTRFLLLITGILAISGAFALRYRRGPEGGGILGQADASRGLRVVTWNIGNVYMGGHRDSRAADEDLPHVAAVIRRSDPDLVALQELRDRRQLDKLLRALGGVYRGFIVSEEVNDRRVAILARAGAPIVFSQLITSTGRAAALAQLHAPGVSLCFAAVHLDAFDPGLRRTQIEELLDWAQRRDEKELIVAGDFNFDADFVLEHDPTHVDVGLYSLLTSHLQDVASLGASTTIVGRRIDYIFARGRWRKRNVRVLGGQTIRLMDHNPLIADFERGL